jgi:hypothetical protein
MICASKMQLPPGNSASTENEALAKFLALLKLLPFQAVLLTSERV